METSPRCARPIAAPRVVPDDTQPRSLADAYGGIRRTLDLPYEDAITQTTAALKAEGFGVLTQIDIRATLKEKLNADFGRYMILGACDPALAHRALSANLDVGLLLPCNVTVYEEGAGSVVTAVDPLEMLRGLAADPATHAVAVEAGTKLRRAIEQITG